MDTNPVCLICEEEFENDGTCGCFTQPSEEDPMNTILNLALSHNGCVYGRITNIVTDGAAGKTEYFKVLQNLDGK